jgi:D-sedoheptulose 7-phosphate isomerase
MNNQANNYFNRISNAFSSVAEVQISQSLSLLKNALDTDATIYLIGNGGSAATASHFAADISKTLNNKGRFGKAVSLCDNSSVVTAISNDFNFDQVFERQLSILANPGDVLVSISASGNSANLVRAINYANQHKIETLSMSGFTGGELAKISKVSLHVSTIDGDYGVAEDCHSILCHFLSEQLRQE